jgi:hypothetical protein
MTIYVYPEDEQRIREIAHVWHCSTSDVVVNALANYDPGEIPTRAWGNLNTPWGCGTPPLVYNEPGAAPLGSALRFVSQGK